MADGCFRSKNGFTVVQNTISRDKTISMKAKGLYLVIQSYITMPDKQWKKDEFFDFVGEGRKAFDSAWNELKNAGYLKTHFISDGKTFIAEYELLDEPKEGPHTFYYNSKGEITHTNETRTKVVHNPEGDDKTVKKAVEETKDSAGEINDYRYPHFGNNGNGSNGNGYNGDGYNGNGSNAKGGNNNNNLNNNTLAKDSSIIPSVNIGNGQTDGEAPVITPTFERMDREDYLWAKDYISEHEGITYDIANNPVMAMILVKYLSNWDMNIEDGTTMQKQSYVLAVQCLTEMITAKKISEYNGARVSYANVIDMLNALCKQKGDYDLGIIVSMCAEHMVNALQKNAIRNHKQYMKSILWTDMSSGELEWMGFMHRSYFENLK